MNLLRNATRADGAALAALAAWMLAAVKPAGRARVTFDIATIGSRSRIFIASLHLVRREC